VGGGAAWLYRTVIREEIEEHVQAAVKRERQTLIGAKDSSALKKQLETAVAERTALEKRGQELQDAMSGLERERDTLAKEKEVQKRLRTTLNETIVDKQETIERMRAEAEAAAKDAAAELSRRSAELAAQQSLLAAVEQNAVALRLELEMERFRAHRCRC
jgi:actin-like ATPase involved in cell morphogenesis